MVGAFPYAVRKMLDLGMVTEFSTLRSLRLDLSSDTTFSFTSFSDQYHESKTTLATGSTP